MKKLYTYLFALLAVCFATTSCEDTDYQVYDASQVNKIYFGTDSVKFSYGAREDLDCDVRIPIKLIGMANLETDVPFVVEIDEYESTAKKDIQFHIADQQLFRKDSVMAYIDLDFVRDNLIKDVSYTLILRLGSNESYVPANNKKCVITFGDTYIEQPAWWKPDRLGTYSQEKLILFIQCFHKTKDTYPVIYEAIESGWGEYLDTPSESNSRFPYLLTTAAYLTYFKENFYKPMYEYYLATGDERYAMPDPDTVY